MRYQLAVLGPGAASHFALLRDAVHEQISALGLDPSQHAEVSTPDDVARVDFAHGSPVCAWFAGDAKAPSPSGHEEILNKFIDEAQPILPVWQGRGTIATFLPKALGNNY